MVSGASALFGHKLDDFGPKCAHLVVPPPDCLRRDPGSGDRPHAANSPPTRRVGSRGIDQCIAAATGFGYDWTSFADAEGAWQIIIDTIDAGHTAKGWDWEGIFFRGYADARDVVERRVFAMADGPDTYARWLTWDEFRA